MKTVITCYMYFLTFLITHFIFEDKRKDKPFMSMVAVPSIIGYINTAGYPYKRPLVFDFIKPVV